MYTSLNTRTVFILQLNIYIYIAIYTLRYPMLLATISILVAKPFKVYI